MIIAIVIAQSIVNYAQSKQLQILAQKNFSALTRFEPVASVSALQCSTNNSIEALNIFGGQKFVLNCLKCDYNCNDHISISTILQCSSCHKRIHVDTSTPCIALSG